MEGLSGFYFAVGSPLAGGVALAAGTDSEEVWTEQGMAL
jgi:hypothetical protein